VYYHPTLAIALLALPAEFSAAIPLGYREVITHKMDEAVVVFRVLCGDNAEISEDRRTRIEALSTPRGSSPLGSISPEKKVGNNSPDKKTGKEKVFAAFDTFTKTTNMFAKESWLAPVLTPGKKKEKSGMFAAFDQLTKKADQLTKNTSKAKEKWLASMKGTGDL